MAAITVTDWQIRPSTNLVYIPMGMLSIMRYVKELRPYVPTGATRNDDDDVKEFQIHM